MRAYHCSPRENRPAIAADGLRGTLPGVYLWGTLETAKAYAQWFDDVWEVDCDGLALKPGGPHSAHPREVWCPTAIPPERLRLVHGSRRVREVDVTRIEVSARGIALDLLRGATAEAIGQKYLEGFSPSYMEIDGMPVQLPPREVKEAPAVRIVYPDGFTALYVASTEEQAEALLARAREVLIQLLT